jgi:hypothetical protein
MRPELSHDEAFAALDAVALDAIDAAEREAVLAHIEGCDVCRAELESLRATAAHLAFATPLADEATIASRARIRGHLMARASASVAVDAHPRRTPTSSVAPQASSPLMFPRNDQAALHSTDPRDMIPPGFRYAKLMAMAASILFVVSLGALGWALNDRQNLREAFTAQAAQSQRLVHAGDSLAAIIAVRDSLLAGLTGRDVSVMTLTSSAAKEPFARMFWDRTHNTWTLITHNMPALKSGRTYQLWLVTPTAKISAGTFDPRNGDAVVRATYALSAPLQALVVTEEPTGGVPQPTGSAVVAVNVGS